MNQVFVVRPESGKNSPLDAGGVSLNISTDEVVAIIRACLEANTSIVPVLPQSNAVLIP